MNRPKGLNKRYGWCRKQHHGVILDHTRPCYRCEIEAKRKAAGLCTAKLGHGPGHQGIAYCHIQGKHSIHECCYGRYDLAASWRGPVWKLKFTGYFDDPPEVTE